MTSRIVGNSGLLRTHHCGELRTEDIGKEVVLTGWVNKYRDLGGLHFIDIRDKYGLTQLGFVNFAGEFSLLKKCHLESTILVKGIVQSRPTEAKNKNMPTGEVEVQVIEFELLSECAIETIPFLPFGATEASEDLKLKYRYLELRTKELQGILKLRSDVTMKVRKSLMEEGFIEVETPILYKSTPEGARDYIVPSRVHPGKVYALPQSPQTLKQLLMIGGTDKYFQICRCFRDEDLRADRQPEFSQIDIETSFSSADYIKNLVEKLVIDLFNLEDDFIMPMMTYDDSIKKYGSDKPDVRFDLEHIEVTDIFKDSAFAVFSKPANSGGLIKAIFIKEEEGSFSRKDLDALASIVKPHGGKGVAFFKVNEGTASGGVSKFISDENLKELQKRSLSENHNGTWLFCADTNPSITHGCADALRRYLGKELNLLKSGYHFLWVYDFPLLVWDEEASRFVAMHHPFTSPKKARLDDFMNGDKEELKLLPAEAYDVVCNGYELGGGSVRIHDQKVQSKMFEALGMSEEEIQSQFGFFIEALKYGVPPHSGLAFGLDRIIMLLAGTDSIRDVIAFPKTTSASDLMSHAPSSPSNEQFQELGLELKI